MPRQDVSPTSPPPERRQLSSIQQSFDLAVRHHNAGRLPEAGAIYQQILQVKPNHFDALHLLGQLSLQGGKNKAAVDFFTKAITIKPVYTDAHFNLGLSLQELGRLEEAVNSYQRALAIKSDHAGAHNNLGNVFNLMGRRDEALASYHRALDIDPGLQDVRHLISALSGITTDIAPEKYVSKLFDHFAGTFDDHLYALEYKIPALMRKTVDFLPDSPKKFTRVLDLGCGTGMVAEKFRDKAGKIYGVDLSPKMLEHADAKGIYANLYLSDVLEFLEGPNVRPAEHDLILSADTFIYIGKLDGIFAAAHRALIDGGLFVISVEHLEDGDFKLLPSGRYSQSDVYIEKLAAKTGFAFVSREHVIVRVENEGPIRGRIFVFRAIVK